MYIHMYMCIVYSLMVLIVMNEFIVSGRQLRKESERERERERERSLSLYIYI